MTFLIVSNVLHQEFGEEYFAYAPYVREMNIWLSYPDKVIIVAPLIRGSTPEKIDLNYNHHDVEFIPIPQFDIQSFKSVIRTLYVLPVLISRIARGMRRADHIHLRCPGNIGLIGCLVQFFFPKKYKTAKYAGNWDWNSKQPWSYRLQQRILRNTFLTRNMTALVYGEWPDKTKNIKPFFTASYFEKDRLPTNKQPLEQEIKLAFIGTLTENKSPRTNLEVLKSLIDKGIKASLTYCGNGPERQKLEQTIKEWKFEDRVRLLGNVNAETVKKVLSDAHFLVFISRSEGWPKAVAEAMWWGCLPITTAVSSVPQMLGNGLRGNLVNVTNEIPGIIINYLSNPSEYKAKCEKAMNWSRQYTLERFEKEIKVLLI